MVSAEIFQSVQSDRSASRSGQICYEITRPQAKIIIRKEISPVFVFHRTDQFRTVSTFSWQDQYAVGEGLNDFADILKLFSKEE